MGGSRERALAPVRLVVRGAARRQRWLLVALLSGTAGVYLVNLALGGWANAFYTAAVQAGTVSWKAFLFGSSDGANSITVDKPPMSLWPMELSARLFGLSPTSVLVPQALMAVASVWLVHRIVSREFGAPAGLIAGLCLALTPIAVVMFRYNNPDALLVLLEIAATAAMLEACRRDSWRWLLGCGVLVGFAVLTKQLAALLVVPGLGLAWLVAGGCSASAAGGRAKLLARIARSFVPFAGIAVGAGWWIALVQLWPESSRPWIGGSQHNSFIELALGYNGLGRLNGDEVGSTIEKMNETGFLAEMKACAAPGFSDPFEPGWSRLVSQDNGGQIGWLLPAALLLAAVSFVLVGRARRTDPRRAQLIAWTGWLVVSGAVFSAMRGIFHPYYTVALAPPVAALVGIGLTLLWAKRERWWARASLVSTVLVTAGTAWTVLGYDDDFLPWLRWAIMGVAIVAAFGLFFLAGKSPQSRSGRVLTSVPVLLGFASALAGPAAFVENTLEHSGEQSAMGLPFAGPVPSSWYYSGWNYPQFLARVEEGCFGGPAMLAERAQMQERWAERGSAGGLLGPAEPDPELVAMLRQNADAYTWVAATVGSSPAAGYQLSTRPPVMPLGGFNGSDPFPTFEQFQRYVAEHRMHYYLAPDDETMDEFAPSDSVKAIHHWAKERFTLVRAFDSVEVYDLTKPKS